MTGFSSAGCAVTSLSRKTSSAPVPRRRRKRCKLTCAHVTQQGACTESRPPPLRIGPPLEPLDQRRHHPDPSRPCDLRSYSSRPARTRRTLLLSPAWTTHPAGVVHCFSCLEAEARLLSGWDDWRATASTLSRGPFVATVPRRDSSRPGRGGLAQRPAPAACLPRQTSRGLAEPLAVS